MFSLRVKELRLENHLTQKQLAEKLRIDESTVRKWELGKTETDFTTLVKIADLFGVSTDFLLGRKDY